MKGLKLSKTSMLILSAGIFIVVLASLGLTRSQQVQEQTKLDEELSITEVRLSNVQIAQLLQQQAELQAQIDESTIQLTEAKNRLRQTVESIDVTDEFFSIAHDCDVLINNISTTTITTEELEGVNCSLIAIDSLVTSDVSNLIDFVISLNTDYTTGVVKSVQISIPETSEESEGCERPSAVVRMVVYSYEGA